MAAVFSVFAILFVVGAALLVRSRRGGTGADPVDPPAHLEGGPIGYGASVAPPTTSRAATVNAPWFSRTHDQARPRSHGPGE